MFVGGGGGREGGVEGGREGGRGATNLTPNQTNINFCKVQRFCRVTASF